MKKLTPSRKRMFLKIIGVKKTLKKLHRNSPEFIIKHKIMYPLRNKYPNYNRYGR